MKGGDFMKSEMINQIKSEERTPIEVVLAIDEDGFTTASAIYKWLELAPIQFARWCKTNIINNPFFENGIDYFEAAENGVFDVMSKTSEKEKDLGGRPSTDYKKCIRCKKRLKINGIDTIEVGV